MFRNSLQILVQVVTSLLSDSIEHFKLSVFRRTRKSSVLRKQPFENARVLDEAVVNRLLEDKRASQPNKRESARSRREYLRAASVIYTVQVQLNTIASKRSTLENGYVELLRHASPSLEKFDKLYLKAKSILEKNPKLLFNKEGKDGQIARRTVDDALIQLRNILLSERNQWAEAEAFERKVTRMKDEIEELYKKVSSLINGELRENYRQARDTLSLPVIALRSKEKIPDLEFVKEVVTELQIIAQSEQEKRLELENQKLRQEEERKLEEKHKQEQRDKEKQYLKRLLIFIGIYLVIPLSLFFAGLAYLIFSYGSVSDYYDIQLPFLGIPYSVLLWSALGSITSMLHFVNKYNEKQFQTPWKVFRWAITRPLVGIIMGVVVFLTVTGGILVTNGDYSPTNYALLWLFAFVGGFSDRMQQAIINLIVGKVPLHLENDPSIEDND